MMHALPWLCAATAIDFAMIANLTGAGPAYEAEMATEMGNRK